MVGQYGLSPILPLGFWMVRAVLLTKVKTYSHFIRTKTWQIKKIQVYLHNH